LIIIDFFEVCYHQYQIGGVLLFEKINLKTKAFANPDNLPIVFDNVASKDHPLMKAFNN